MGHVRLGVLPRTRKWRQVVEELRLGADVAALANAAADAAEASLEGASADPAFLHAFWLLTQIPLAARGPSFAADLRRLGLAIADRPGLMDVAAALADAVDRHTRDSGGRTDLGEMAQMAAVESLVAAVGPSLPTLFGTAAEEAQREIGRFASSERFSTLARGFFARLTQRCLGYFLSRELANHVGPEKRFPDDAARARFDQALDCHCVETARIVETFAAGWYGKRVYGLQHLKPGDVRRFAPVAFRKIRKELRIRRDAAE